MRTIVLACILVFGTLHVKAIPYPSTYPFDVEYDLPEATPSFTYDDTDPGGYFRTALYCDFNDQNYAALIEQRIFIPHWDCGFYMHRFNEISLLTKILSNCSTNNEIYEASTMQTNARYGDTYATCDEYLGWGAAYGGTTTEQLLNPAMALGGCGTPPEEIVCLTIVEALNYCPDYYLSPGERLQPLLPCPDGYTDFLTSCPSMVIPFSNVGLEPESYYSQLSVTQTIWLQGIRLNADRLCHPYSYYHPATNGANEDSSSPSVPTEESSSVRNKILHMFV